METQSLILFVSNKVFYFFLQMKHTLEIKVILIYTCYFSKLKLDITIVQTNLILIISLFFMMTNMTVKLMIDYIASYEFTSLGTQNEFTKI